MTFQYLPRLTHAALAALVASLAACANMAGIEPVAVMRDANAMGLPANAEPGSAMGSQVIANLWWLEFNDPELNTLMAQALADSPSLKLVQTRLVRARAVNEVADAALLPQVNAGLDLTRQLYTKNGAVPPPLAGAQMDSGTLQLTASWELDFFGKYRAALDAALGTVKAAQADAQAAQVLLSANVAKSYFATVRLNEQIVVARRALALREETLILVRDRVNAGLDSRLELKQSEGSLPETRQQIEALLEQQALAHNVLAALVGRPNSPQVPVSTELSAIRVVATPVNLSADLLGRRADIAAARWRVEAARNDVVNAKTQFYPNINLMAFAGFSSIGLNHLLESGSAQWGVGPALRLPLFEGGRLRANLTGKTADYDAAVESYNQAVIEAIHDVADQLVSVKSIALQQVQQQSAQAALETAYEIAIQRYKAGLGNYLNVLAAESPLLAQRRQAVDLAGRALEARVALIRAAGGGYAPKAVAAASR